MLVGARTPINLWLKLNLLFITGRKNNLEDYEDTGIADYIHNNLFYIQEFNPRKLTMANEKIKKIYIDILGYDNKLKKLTTLHRKYIDRDKLEELRGTLKQYKNKKRYTLGMTFKSTPARSGGCLSSIVILKEKSEDKPKIFFQTRIHEIPMKFFADLLFFAQILRLLNLEDTYKVYIQNCSLFFWVITMPLLIQIPEMLDKFKDEKYIHILSRDIMRAEYLASPEYKYRNQARVWKHLLENWNEEWVKWARRMRREIGK